MKDFEPLIGEWHGEGAFPTEPPMKMSVEAKVERQYERLHIADEAEIVRLVTNAARTLGRTCPTRSTGGGSDANVFITRGIEVANLACGMRDIHTVNEWVDVKDLVATAELVLETVKANATPA